MLKGWKTIIFSVANAALMALEAADVTDLLTESQLQLWTLGITVAYGVLRWATTTPIFKAE